MTIKHIFPYFLIALLVFILVGIFVFSTIGTGNDIERDKITLCRTDGVIPQHDIVLVDGTDKLSPANILETRKLIQNKILRRLPKDGRLTIISFTGDVDGFINGLFTRCNPGSGKEINVLFGNKKREDEKWKNNFINVLGGFLVKLENIPTADSTPLLETLEMISQDSDFSPEIEKRRIFIISDLLQSHNGVSFYTSNLNFENEMKKPYFEKLDIELDGVEIIIYQIERPNDERHTYTNYQGKKQQEFWKGLFDKWNADDVDVHRPSRLQPLTPITEEN